jgi:hypothetical protein
MMRRTTAPAFAIRTRAVRSSSRVVTRNSPSNESILRPQSPATGTASNGASEETMGFLP